MERFRTWHEILMERLSNPEDVTGYLEVSLEEYLDDGDKAFFLKGIKNVVEAQGGIFSVSEQAGIDPGVLLDAVHNGSMPPYDILSSFFTHFGGVINLPLRAMTPQRGESVRKSEALSNSPEWDFDAERSLSERSRSLEEKTPLRVRESESVKEKTFRQKQNERYWTALCEFLDRRRSYLQRPKVNDSNTGEMPFGIPGFSLRAGQTVKSSREIRASLVVRGANAIPNFYSLRVQEEEIEKDWGDKLEWWGSAKSVKRVGVRNREVDPSDEKDWHNQHEWLVDNLEKIYTVFQPRLEELVRLSVRTMRAMVES